MYTFLNDFSYFAGIVHLSPRNHDQIAMTHPKMFPFFGVDREELFLNQHKKGSSGTMRQVQAGLMLVDAANSTMRRTFFQEWADCAANDDCLIPDKVQINKTAGQALAIHSINGTRVFRLVGFELARMFNKLKIYIMYDIFCALFHVRVCAFSFYHICALYFMQSSSR